MPVRRIERVPDSMLKNEFGLGRVGAAEGISKEYVRMARAA